ncbi:MAG: WG repeat-containing protein [Clostridia bacterium]|nr:WG repeat-containing protein [Clostridia bacterium]
MSYNIEKYKKYLSRIAAAVIVFGIAFAVFPHVIEKYGEKPEESAGVETNSQLMIPETDSTETAEPESETTADTTETTAETTPILPETVKEDKNIVNVIDTALLSGEHTDIPGKESLAAEGYADSQKPWNHDTMRLGRITLPMELPDAYSISTMDVEKIVYKYPDDTGEITVSTVTEQAERPVLSLYMGYMLYDDGEYTQLLYKNGKSMMRFDETQIKPGYTRDKYGTPLFYRWKWDAEEGMVKVWYKLSYDGSAFAFAEYDDERDNRGLYFDYPASYGVTDNTALTKVWEEEEALETRLQEEADAKQEKDEEWQEWYDTLVNEEKRNRVFYERQQEEKAEEINSPRYEKPLIAYYKNETDLTGHKFMQAFNFRSGLSAVTENTDRGALYFINEYGNKVMGQVQSYYWEAYERYVISSYRMPLTNGIESIGSFYLDHGLVRVRKQIIDYSGLLVYNVIRVIIDEDVLVDRNGKEHALPAGFTLRGYSDGMILLEKNGRFGVMDYTGNWIAEPIYAAADPFVDGLAALTTADGRVGMIDTEGNIVLPFAYEYISQASSGLVVAYDAELGWQAFQIMEK